MRPRLLWGVLATVAALAGAPASAATVEVPSCYAMPGVGIKPLPPRRELIVVVDQTIKLNANLQETANQKVQKFLKAGDRIVLVSFSAFAQDRFSEIVLDAGLDEDIPEDRKFTTGKALLSRMSKCLREQEVATRQLVASYFQKLFKESKVTLPNTELIGTLTSLSREFMTGRPAEKRLVFLISDMLEHSALTSFYANNRIRRIEPEKEMEKVRRSGMIAALTNVDVYVHGAGFTDDGRYRSAVEMRAIEEFWGRWITASGGVLKGYGAPALFPELGQ